MKIAIQTVPSRAEWVGTMLLKLPECNTHVYGDVNMLGSLWNMERILRDSPNGVLILQDDVIIPPWFLREVEASMIPGEMMSYFVGLTARARALYDRGFCYAKSDNVWGQATYWPAGVVADYIDWSNSQPAPFLRSEDSSSAPHRKFSADDTSICEFLKATGRWAYLTLPNLVNHLEVPSVLGHPTRIGGKARVSPVFGEALLRPWDANKITKL